MASSVFRGRSVGFCPAWQVGAIRSGSVYGVLWGVCSGCGYLFGDSAIQGAAWLVVAPGAIAPAVASASCQHFGADRLGVVCPWNPRRGFCSSIRVTVSGILGGVLGLLVLLPRLMGVWRGILLTF